MLIEDIVLTEESEEFVDFSEPFEPLCCLISSSLVSKSLLTVLLSCASALKRREALLLLFITLAGKTTYGVTLAVGEKAEAAFWLLFSVVVLTCSLNVLAGGEKLIKPDGEVALFAPNGLVDKLAGVRRFSANGAGFSKILIPLEGEVMFSLRWLAVAAVNNEPELVEEALLMLLLDDWFTARLKLDGRDFILGIDWLRVSVGIAGVCDFAFSLRMPLESSFSKFKQRTRAWFKSVLYLASSFSRLLTVIFKISFSSRSFMKFFVNS